MKLFIIGNGFDINHGYKTNYLNFRDYLYSHKYPMLGFDLSNYFSDNSDDLWSDFENNLEFIDSEEETEFFVGGTLNLDDMSDREWERECSIRSALHDSFVEAPKTILPVLCTALSDFICEQYKKNCAVPKVYFSNLFNTQGKEYYENEDDISNEIIPNRCLKNMNKELEKSYQLTAFKDFISNELIEAVEIIGHDIGPVDDPYFKLLNQNIEKKVPVNYWLYDQSKER